MKTERITRVLKTIQFLQAGQPLSPADLAERLNVSRRTLFRDLKALEAAGIPYRFDRSSQTYSVGDDSVLPPINLTPYEAITLLMLIRKLLDTEILPDRAPAVAAGLKVESILPRSLQDYCEPLLENIEIRPAARSDAYAISDTFTLLQRALAARAKVRTQYNSQSPRELVKTVVSAYRIVYIHRGWYVIGFSSEHQEVRTFKIERFIKIEVLDDTYAIDPDFSLDDYFGNAWCMIREPLTYHVTIEFSPMVAGNVSEVMWHKTQRITHSGDGAILFEVDVDGLREMSWWILGYGDHARVVEPPELRDMIAQRVRGMNAYYNGKGVVQDGDVSSGVDASDEAKV